LVVSRSEIMQAVYLRGRRCGGRNREVFYKGLEALDFIYPEGAFL
jgi:hypothetical protein